jgi:uncharacterized protein (TIGR02301 family)
LHDERDSGLTLDMNRVLLSILISCLLAVDILSQAALAADKKTSVQAPKPPEVVVEEKPAPYDDRLVRLSEIMGSLQYLRNLCQSQKEDQWRLAVQQLLETEALNEPARQARLTAAFNRGYRSFAALYTTCTAAAIVGETRYRTEGATLVAEIVARYGN